MIDKALIIIMLGSVHFPTHATLSIKTALLGFSK